MNPYSSPIKKDDIRSVSERLCHDIDEIQKEGDRYLHTFPQDVLLGLSAYVPSSKDLTAQYYSYASRICNIVSEQINTAIVDCSSLLLRADHCGQSELMCPCSNIIAEHEIFSREFRRFLNAMEHLFLTKDTLVNLRGAVNELRTFRFRLNAVQTNYKSISESLN